jgi:serine O-acetyltransferase
MPLDPLRLHRLAHTLHRRKVPLVPSLLSGLNRLANNIAIAPGCRIGEETRLGYGGIGSTVDAEVEIGERSMICQQVQLRGRVKIGNDVLIGAGASVSGPVTIGDGAQIGANAVVDFDVPPGAVAAGVPATLRLAPVREAEPPQVSAPDVPPFANAGPRRPTGHLTAPNVCAARNVVVGTPGQLVPEPAAPVAPAPADEAQPPDRPGPTTQSQR